MIKTIKKRICDVCNKEVASFAGSLKLEYAIVDYTGCGAPAGFEIKDICLDCCRKLDKAILEVRDEAQTDSAQEAGQ